MTQFTFNSGIYYMENFTKVAEADIPYSKMNTTGEFSVIDSSDQSSFSTDYDEAAYFSADRRTRTISKKIKRADNKKAFDKIHEIYVFFHLKQFFEVLLCHCLHNMLLGPLSIPFLLLIFPKNFIYNIKLLPQFSLFYVSHIALWFVMMGYYLLALFRPPADYHLPCTHLMTTILLMNLTLRQIVMSLKYGYYTAQKYKFLKKHKIPAEALSREDSIYFWASQQDNEIIMREIYSTIRRNEIELSLFYLDFIVQPDEKTDKRLKEMSDIVKEKIYSYADAEELGYRCHLSEKNAIKELCENRIFGGVLIYDMIINSRTKTRKLIHTYFKIFIVLALIGSVLQSFMAAIDSGTGSTSVVFTLDFPRDLYNWFVVGSFWIVNAVASFFNLLNFSLGIITAKARCNMMRQLNYMITPRKKAQNEGIQKYPTINLFDAITLKTWCSLKRVAIEFGKKYQKRAETGVSFQLLFYFVYMIVLVYQIFFTQQQFYDYRALLIVWYHLALALGLTIYLMTVVAHTNEIYQIMKGHAKEIRDILSDFILIKSNYLQKDMTPRNMLYQLFYKKLRTEFQNFDRTKFVAASITYLRNLISCFNDIVKEITYDQTNYPARALEIPFTSGLLKRVTIGVMSLAFSAMSYFIHRVSVRR